MGEEAPLTAWENSTSDCTRKQGRAISLPEVLFRWDHRKSV